MAPAVAVVVVGCAFPLALAFQLSRLGRCVCVAGFDERVHAARVALESVFPDLPPTTEAAIRVSFLTKYLGSFFSTRFGRRRVQTRSPWAFQHTLRYVHSRASRLVYDTLSNTKRRLLEKLPKVLALLKTMGVRPSARTILVTCVLSLSLSNLRTLSL